MSKIQVLIPAFNAAKYISQTIESVLIQGVSDLEIVILDNASTDDTLAIAAEYANEGIRCVSNELNIGAIGNHNRALSIASADYIKLLSADDVLLPGVLLKQSAVLDLHHDVGVVSCNCILTDEKLNPRSGVRYLSGYQLGEEAIFQCVKKISNLVGAPSNTLLRRSAINDARFNPNLKWLGDLDFICQILSNSNYFNIDENGFLYRRHDATDSLLSCPISIRLHDEILFARKYGGGTNAYARIIYRALSAMVNTNPVLRNVFR